MDWKKKLKKLKQPKAPDRLDLIQKAITDGGRPAKSILRAFHTLMRQDAEDDSWAGKEFRQPKDRKKD